MKLCTSCKQILPKASFSKNRAKADGLQTACKQCKKIWYDNYYLTNPKEKARLARDRDANRDANYAWIAGLKAAPCADCGVSYPTCVMDFDHQGDKEFSIGASMTKSRAALQREIDKCELVCANCHRIRTHMGV